MRPAPPAPTTMTSNLCARSMTISAPLSWWLVGRREVAHGVAHLLEGVRPQGHHAHHEDQARHREQDGLGPEAGPRPAEVVLDAVAQSVHAVEQREAEQE